MKVLKDIYYLQKKSGLRNQREKCPQAQSIKEATIIEIRGKDTARGGQDKSNIKCFNCNIYGHYASECRKPRRERKPKQEINLTHDDEPTLLIVETRKLLLNEDVVPKLSQESRANSESNLWYLDNGASNHMTGQRSKFKSLDEGVMGQVRFGDGSTVDIKGKGSIGFKCKTGEEITFHEVYYIPRLCNNIISLGQLSETGNKIVLKDMYLWVYEDDGRLIMKVKRSTNRLYKIILETVETNCMLTRVEQKSWLWHARLGHVNFGAMTMMTTGKMAHGLPELIQPRESCEGCLMSKQARQSFPCQAERRAKQVLELVHGDLCGPITPETSAGNRYFLFIG